MRNSVQAVVNKLLIIIEKVEGYKANAEEAEYPNEERIEKLDNELDQLTEAMDTLEGIE